jgi:hypothetical protein
MCAFLGWASRDSFFNRAQLTEARMNNQNNSIYSYEQQKAAIVKKNLSPEEYQRQIKALAKNLGV